MYEVLNIKIVVLCMETWTTEDRYGNFSSNPDMTLLLFRTYTDYYVQESYDAAILLT